MPESRSISAPGAAREVAERSVPIDLELGAPDEGPRRVLNVVVATIAAIIAFPAMIVIGILVKLSSSGPILYRQTRVGVDRRIPGDELTRHGRLRSCDLGGRPFVMYKFRTMHTGAERTTGAVWAKRNDPRITPIGAVLRQTRLDELPQLFNVIKGDMNVVGPRPERPSIFVRLSDEFPDYRLRQRVRPGITGLAQISQHYDSSLADVRRKVDFDLQYIRNATFAMDLKIMLKTLPVILFRRGGW